MFEQNAANDCVIVGAKRSPFGRFGGALKDLTLPQLASHAIKAALVDAGINPEDVEELALGVNLPGSDRSIARQALLQSGIPDNRNAYTCDRACCSSLNAISHIFRAIRLGEIQVGVAGGSENMSRVPYFVENLRFGMAKPLGEVVLKDQLIISCPHTGVPRAVQASEEAARYNISREQQDLWALRSQQRCDKAIHAGYFDNEIAAVDLVDFGFEGDLQQDELPRPDTSLEKLSALKPVNGSETVTAGNAPGLGTGSSAIVMTSRAEAQRRGLQLLATVVTTAMASGTPANIASIPAEAARKVLAKACLTVDDIDLIEINEAFAAVPLVTLTELSAGDRERMQQLAERTNVNGGSVALGHPTSATAARMVMTLAYELRRRGGGIGLVTICGGIGEAEAAIIRVEKIRADEC